MAKRKTPWYETPEFLALRKEWYDKLKAEGHRDIEIVDWRTGEAGNLLLGFSEADARKTYTPEAEAYYLAAERHVGRLEGKPGVSAELVTCWTLHAQGCSNREIERRTGVPREKVARLIRAEQQNMAKEDGEDST